MKSLSSIVIIISSLLLINQSNATPIYHDVTSITADGTGLQPDASSNPGDQPDNVDNPGV
jgi:hypothetical protein